MEPTPPAELYLFRFDAPIPRRIFGEKLDLGGWLVRADGKPIRGIRAVLRRTLTRRRIFAARRKRSRPDVAAAFPDLTEAKTSGFLLELSLPFGRNYLDLQLREEDRSWHSFHSLVISAYPFRFLARLGLCNVRDVVITYLQKRVNIRRLAHRSSVPPARISTARSERLLVTKVNLFATTKSNLFILEIGRLISAGFRELGRESQLLLDQIPDKNPPPDTLQVIVTPHEYYNLFLSHKVSSAKAAELTKNAILFCTEQPETGWFYNNLPWAEKARAVADLNSLGVEAYRMRGIDSYHFRLGYHNILATSHLMPHAERKMDITFIGAMTNRRDEFFARYAPFFSEHHCHIRFVPLGFAKTNVTRSYLDESRRNALLNDSRILLNLHYSEQKYFEWHRALVALANGCCLITETSEGYADLVPGRHFIMAEPDDLIACCEYYLTHPDEAEAIARAGNDFIRTHLRQSAMCSDFVNALQSHSQSKSIAVDSPPHAMPKPLARTIAKTRARRLWRALGQDWQNLTTRPTASAPDPSPAPGASERQLVLQRRETYRLRLTQQHASRARSEKIWSYHDNESYQPAQHPGLSVVITLFNYAHHIGECFASIERAAASVPGQVEVVIINDASSDESLAQAIACQKMSRLPVRIVDKQLNTGLADARNVGIEIARAPYIFMMDADNLVYPGAISQLLRTITNENAAAAYSLLCRFKGTTDNRVGLLSYYDWDPQILVQQPYIDAMAMFRRDVLLQFRYDTALSQIGWFGWEDYELWLRFAQRNYKVAFLPNILCLYRHHDTSMINVTNLFEIELVEHFMDRFQDLAGKFEPREMLFGVMREKIPGLRNKPAFQKGESVSEPNAIPPK